MRIRQIRPQLSWNRSIDLVDHQIMYIEVQNNKNCFYLLFTPDSSSQDRNPYLIGR
jgi:hypothetical protein